MKTAGCQSIGCETLSGGGCGVSKVTFPSWRHGEVLEPNTVQWNGARLHPDGGGLCVYTHSVEIWI